MNIHTKLMVIQNGSKKYVNWPILNMPGYPPGPIPPANLYEVINPNALVGYEYYFLIGITHNGERYALNMEHTQRTFNGNCTAPEGVTQTDDRPHSPTPLAIIDQPPPPMPLLFLCDTIVFQPSYIYFGNPTIPHFNKWDYITDALFNPQHILISHGAINTARWT